MAAASFNEASPGTAGARWEAFCVKPAAFAYAKARSLDHALELLRGEPESKVLAGGQSLMPTLNMRLSAPRLLVDINHIHELRDIVRNGDWLEIGALVRHAQAEQAPDIARLAPLLALALPHIAHPAIRNRGTIGGSIALADPAAELPACIVALDGEIEIAGSNGQRRVKAEAFFKGLFETALGPHEVVTSIRVPVAKANERFGFGELARRHGDYALAGLAARAQADGATLRDTRLVYFGVGTTPVRARKAEAALAGGHVEAAVAALADDLNPNGDVHASAAARRHLAGVLLTRVAQQLRGRLS
jgi:aerobic carbon-monoxide dehydrogenase medium subunit